MDNNAKQKNKNFLRTTVVAVFLLFIFVVSNAQPVEAKTKVKLSKKSITLISGDKYTLKVKGVSSTVKWSSNNKKIATVNKKGTVLAKNAGSCKITAKVNGKKYTCKVKVLADVGSSKITGISIASKPSKLTYYKDDKLSSDGLSIKVKYENGESEVVDEGFSCSPTELTRVGNQTITVSYQGQKTSFDVKVNNDEVSEISIIKKPYKLEFAVDEEINIDGISVELKYASGKKKETNEGLTFSPKSFRAEGMQTVYVTYGQKTCNYNVTVKKAQLTSIELRSLPNKLEYFDDEKLDTTGMVLVGKYSNGKTKEIDSGYTCAPMYLSVSDVNSEDYTERQSIVVKYENMSTNFEVVVKAIVETAISVEPNKTSYRVGESISASDLSVKVIFSDGYSEVLTEGYTISPTQLSDAGDQEITVSYEGLSAKYNVQVEKKEISHIVIETTPNKSVYKIGESIDLNGLSVSAVYKDGTKETVENGLTCSPKVLDQEGTVRITVSFEGYDTVFEVIVEDVWVLLSDVPAGATITQRKWVYDRVEMTESTESYLDGWTYKDSYWKDLGTQTITYSNEIPSTFDTNSDIYRTLANAPAEGYETDTGKREVNNRFAGYCYWHFMYDVSYYETTGRAISDRYGMYDTHGRQGKGFGYWYFSAFLSSVDAPYLDNLYCCSRNQPSYDCRNIMPDKSSLGTGTPRYFRFNYYESVYTDYEKVFRFTRSTREESYSEVYPSDSITNVLVYVKYRM